MLEILQKKNDRKTTKCFDEKKTKLSFELFAIFDFPCILCVILLAEWI